MQRSEFHPLDGTRRRDESIGLADAGLASRPGTQGELGSGLGLVLGLALAGAREMKDTSLKNLKDVRAYTQMTILGSVPLLENDFSC